MTVRIMIAEDQTMVRRNHLSAAIQKVGARNRGEAVQFAQQKGWL